MLSRQIREMKRQAGVVTVRKREIYNVSKLPEGTYMSRDSVLEYLYTTIGASTLGSNVEERCDVYITDNGIEFIPTSQIKIYTTPQLLREMQCEIVSVLVINQK